MFLSIIIPIWNDEKYLEECLNSCLEQDISKDDYEIICIDDGSTDRTPEILKCYAARYTNIHVITKQHGTAYGFGRNIGYERAVGDYLWFVDHDDIIAPNILGELKTVAEENADIDRVAFPYYAFYNELTPTEKEYLQKGALTPNDGEALLELALWSGIIRADFFRAHDIWPHSKRTEAAAAFWGIDDFLPWGGDNICMEECFDNGMKTKLLSGRPIYHYRRHEASQTMSLSKQYLSKKETQQFCSGLLRGYLALQLKNQYLAERNNGGRASSETAVAMILKMRRCVSILSGLSGEKWSEGMKLLKSRDFFLQHKPEEYTFSFRDYFKTRSIREKLSLSTYAYYYMFTLSGARMMRFLSGFKRMRGINAGLIRAYRNRKQSRLINKGLSPQK